MPVLNRLAHSQGRGDEVPNQELARHLARKQDKAGIRDIAAHLWDKDKNIQADCIKVLYEIGYLDPSLIAPYAEDFIRLLSSRNNRLAWGGMTALAAVAELRAEVIFAHLTQIQRAMQAGSVITVDGGVQTLARAASKSARINAAIFPYLLSHLRTCRPKDVPQHSEKTLPALNACNKAAFIKTLEKRLQDLSGSGLARLKKVIRQAQAF
jgi:hypothetical protein